MADIKQTKTDATVVDQLLKQVAGLKFPELPLPLNVTPSTLLLFVKETLAEENQQGKPQLDKLLKILLHENDSAKLLGLNKISDQKIAKATERLNSLADKHEQLKDPEIVAELIKITYDLISELPKSDKQIILSKLIQHGLASLDINEKDAKLYSNLISRFIANADPKKIDAIIDVATKLATTNLDKITPEILIDKFLEHPDKLSVELQLSAAEIKKAQTGIAETFAITLKEVAKASGHELNTETLALLLNPNSSAAIIKADGQYHPDKIGQIASTIADNLLNQPKSEAEIKARNEAYCRKEAEHQQTVRSTAHSQIEQTRLGIFDRPDRRRKNRAHGAANTWGPGYTARGIIPRAVTNKMNEGYYDSQGLAQTKMREGVIKEISTQANQSLSKLSPEDQLTLKLLGKLLNAHHSNTGSTQLRLDDLLQLGKLEKVAKGLWQETPINEIDPSRIVNYSSKKGSNGETFDVFQDSTSNLKYYRLTDRSGNISYAKSTDGRNYNYINRNDEQSLFKSLELYESRMLGEKKSTKAILTSDNKTSSINPEQQQSTPLTAGIEKITDTAEISSKYRNIDFNKYNVFSYKEDNGSIGYALVPKTNTNSAGLCSIRNGRIENYVLSEIYNKLPKA